MTKNQTRHCERKRSNPIEIATAFGLAMTIFIFTPAVLASRFESDSYIIDTSNFNMTGGKKDSSSYGLTDTVGQNAPGQYDSSSYILKSGFQYIYDLQSQFSFTIDQLDIGFGTLIPQIGTTQSNTITVTTPSGHGYQILAHQNHPLQTNPGAQIPNFTGDNSLADESTSDTWNLSTTYGFGFNAIGINSSGVATGIGTSQYFADSTYFRQFADYSAVPPEISQVIMSESSPVEDHSARITYKINISPLQTAGDYQNAITFTAVPIY